LGKKLTAHSFRHTYASIMAKRSSYNPHVLKEILGHHQLTTTDRYIHARSTAEVVDVMEFLPSPQDDQNKLGVRDGGQKEKEPAATGS
jgi:integrase